MGNSSSAVVRGGGAHDELGEEEGEREADARNLLGERQYGISMQSVCNQYAISVQSVCSQYAISMQSCAIAQQLVCEALGGKRVSMQSVCK